MGRRSWAVVGSLTLAMMVAPRAASGQGTGPSFDCRKAAGEVEKLICGDTGLSALDRQLQTVYRAATALALGQAARTLAAEQRGWISGRNECGKAQADNPSFLTASWTVDTAKACVDAQYRLRIAELQAVWHLAPAEGPVFYQCGGSATNEVAVTYFKTDLPAARIERGDRKTTAYLVPVKDGKTYEGQNVSFQRNGRALTVRILNVNTGQEEALGCQTR